MAVGVDLPAQLAYADASPPEAARKNLDSDVLLAGKAKLSQRHELHRGEVGGLSAWMISRCAVTIRV